MMTEGNLYLDLLWVLLGLAGGSALAYYAERSRREAHVLGLSLLLVASVYVLFALYPFNVDWIKVEVTGVFLYLLFWRLGMKFGLVWIGIGWLLHPVWDVGIHLLGPGTELAPRWYVLACIPFDLVVGCYALGRSRWPRRLRSRPLSKP